MTDVSSNGESNDVRCQVCIVGAGAAGITLALELGKRRYDVVLVPGGGWEQSSADRDLYRGTIDRPGAHEPLEEFRHRAFGGSTKRWGGRLVPFDPIDFERRGFVPLSGWPIDYEEIARHYAQAMALCEVAPNDFRLPPDAAENDLPALLGRGAIDTTSCERWSTPTDFGARYRRALEGLPNVRVLIDYHATDVRLSRCRQNVREVIVKSDGGRPLRVAADMFVLAAGGIENARLLLASRNQVAEGVGNHTDQVGRCYMSHIAGTYGRLRLKHAAVPSFYRWQFDAQGAYCRRRFQLTEQAQRELGVMNVIGFPFRPEPGDLGHRDAVMSMLFLRESLRLPVGERPPWQELLRHAGNMAWNSPAAWWSVVRQIQLRGKRPRLPFFTPHNRRAQDTLYFQSEHAPNRRSRLVLSAERDRFGMPRISPRVAFLEIDLQTVKEFYRELDRSLRESGLGALEYDAAGLDAHLRHLTSNFSSMAHHLGTTRMSTDPRLGVVDPNCRVHSVRNLYVSGGSVFPTSSHANPTLTIIALALRLANHLEVRLSPIRMESEPVRNTNLATQTLMSMSWGVSAMSEVSSALESAAFIV